MHYESRVIERSDTVLVYGVAVLDTDSSSARILQHLYTYKGTCFSRAVIVCPSPSLLLGFAADGDGAPARYASTTFSSEYICAIGAYGYMYTYTRVYSIYPFSRIVSYIIAISIFLYCRRSANYAPISNITTYRPKTSSSEQRFSFIGPNKMHLRDHCLV